MHKVIRWAFEVQGLYNPFGKITNAPGAPPPVDIYIEDLRPTLETARTATSIMGPAATIRSRLSGIPIRAKTLRPRNGKPIRPSPCPRVAKLPWSSAIAAPRGAECHGQRLVACMAGSEPLPHGTPQAWTHSEPARRKTSMREPGNHFEFRRRAACRHTLHHPRESKLRGRSRQHRSCNQFAVQPQGHQLVDLVSGDNNIGLRVLGHP